MLNDNQKVNRLINEKSPYLMQHAHNPVEWYPWGQEAFDNAKREDKPIFLSIGYSTCHWCHVMAHESFEDDEVAKHMNEVFISIKVDREERPDIDNIYMSVCQMMTGSGGWPLTIVMTPDEKPFFAATYLPKKSKYGRMGMLELTAKIHEMWNNERENLLESADSITKAIQREQHDTRGELLERDTLDIAFNQFSQMFDEQYGGFREAPKFPTPHNLMFLLRYWKMNNEKRALDMVVKTLDSMAMGGIFDHLGFGFHRYSTDEKWLVPHFEKMLYDQALLAMTYTEGYLATGSDKYMNIAEKIFQYVNRNLRLKEGVFCSAEDADSEGEEGKFYVWKIDDIKKVLDDKETNIVIKNFNLTKEGNFREESTRSKTGNNILYLKNSIEFEHESIRQKLFTERELRIKPHRDEKVLVDWNGLIIVALAKAGAAFNKTELIDNAKNAADFILTSMNKNSKLFHRYAKGEWAIDANIDDYAFLTWGLIELYEACFEVKYLKAALTLNQETLDMFWDNEKGGFFFTSSTSERLLTRSKEIYDGAIPAGNSIALYNLLRLARITGNNELEERAEDINRAFSKTIQDMPYAYSQFLTGVTFQIGSSFEVIITGDTAAEDTKKLLKGLNQSFIPNKVVVLKPVESNANEILNLAPYIKENTMINNKATAYVCSNYSCKKPVNNVEEMLNYF